MRKARVSLRATPITAAIFANSPFADGTISGLRSQRSLVWLNVDPDRSGMLPSLWSPKSTLTDYVTWALKCPMFLIKRGDEIIDNQGQTFADFLANGFGDHRARLSYWELHLNTMFPEVRLKKTLEIRSADSVPTELVPSLAALWGGVLYDDRALSEAESMLADVADSEWLEARLHVHRLGLSTPVAGRTLGFYAERLLDIAKGGLHRRMELSHQRCDETGFLLPLIEMVSHGKSPADFLIEGLDANAPDFKQQVIERTKL